MPFSEFDWQQRLLFCAGHDPIFILDCDGNRHADPVFLDAWVAHPFAPAVCMPLYQSWQYRGRLLAEQRSPLPGTTIHRGPQSGLARTWPLLPPAEVGLALAPHEPSIARRRVRR